MTATHDLTVDGLSQEETAAVLRMRKERDDRAAADAFVSKAIATAHAFDVWSKQSGEGLTFSTLINTFGYHGTDGRRMYEAIKRINAAALAD